MITMLRYIGLRVSANTPLETTAVVGRIGIMELLAFQIACAPERARIVRARSLIADYGVLTSTSLAFRKAKRWLNWIM